MPHGLSMPVWVGHSCPTSDSAAHNPALQQYAERIKVKSVGQECPTHTVSASLRVMDYLWTPWRYAYITAASKGEGNSEVGCIFCELPKLPDADAKIVHRGQHCYTILNSFPYTSGRSEEHTSELQSRRDLVCRLLLEKK